MPRPHRPIPFRLAAAHIDAIAERVALDDSGCLIWLGNTVHAKGSERPRFTVHNGASRQSGLPRATSFLVSRLIYTWVAGVHPGPLQVDHRETCSKLCVHPAHLTAMTHRQNMAKWAATITHCPQNHDYTPENTGIYVNAAGHRRRYCRTCARANNHRAYTAHRAAARAAKVAR